MPIESWGPEKNITLKFCNDGVVRWENPYIITELTDGSIAISTTPSYFPPFDGGLERIPVGRKEMIEVYGDPGCKIKRGLTGKIKVVPSKKWEYKNCSTIPAKAIPGYHRKIYMHTKVAPYFREAMRRATSENPLYKFKKIGCFNPRFMRFNPEMPLSDHTWGIAFDINSSQNKSFTRGKTTPMPLKPGWEEFSDIPEGVVCAFESVGFEWGGRWGKEVGGYVDPMHFSLRRTR